MKTLLAIRVIPNARKNEVVGPYGSGVKIRLQAPPVYGRADDALISFLAGCLDHPAREISVKSGGKSRSKVLEIVGLDEETVRRKLIG